MSEWHFSEDDRCLLRPEQVEPLNAKAAAVLACLRRHKGKPVTTQMSLEQV